MDWIHCNICFRQPCKDKLFSLTSCGHMYCDDCLSNGTENGSCKVCHTKCSCIQLVPDMKSEVKEFFAEPEEILNKLLRVLDFQKQHRMKLTTHWITLNSRYQDTKTELKRMQKVCEKMYGNLKELHKENKNLKATFGSHPADRISSQFCSPQPLIPMSCNSGRSHIVQNTPSRLNQDFKSNLVTPLRVNKQRFALSSGQSAIKYPVTNQYGGQNVPSYANPSTFLTPPLDTPNSKHGYSPSCDPHHQFNANMKNHFGN